MSFDTIPDYKTPVHFSLEGMYRERCDTPSDIYLHLPRFVEMVVERNAQHVIELGSRSGVSTVAWLYGLAKTGGHLTSVDLDAAPDIGRWSHWRHIQGDDLDPALYSSLEQADIVFLDTNHWHEHTYAELNLYINKVKPNGLIVCHDTMLGYPDDAPVTDPRFPVRRAIEKFCADRSLTWEHIRECWGLGVITIP